jgi:hypothetical protein
MENIEQAYVQFRVPIGNGLDFKFGKFVTLLGYEVIETPANLNVTRGFLFSLGLPLTHTGILASYKINDNWDIQLGLVNGWNNSDSNFLGARPWYDNGDKVVVGVSDTYEYYGYGSTRTATDVAKALIGRVGFNGGAFSSALSFIWSFDGDAAIGRYSSYPKAMVAVPVEKDTNGSYEAPPSVDVYENGAVILIDWWLQWKPTEQLLVAVEAIFGKAYDTTQFIEGREYNDPQNSDQWWGAALYAKYQFNKVFSLAGRAEYFHTEDGLALGVYDSNRPIKANAYEAPWEYDRIPQNWNLETTHTDLYSFTLTAGFDVWENLLMRLEYRLDVVSAAGPDWKTGNKSYYTEDNFFTNNRSYQSTVVFDVSYSF